MELRNLWVQGGQPTFPNATVHLGKPDLDFLPEPRKFETDTVRHLLLRPGVYGAAAVSEGREDQKLCHYRRSVARRHG